MTKFTFPEYPQHKDADIAIIGAGVSGLYCAWRLIEDDPKLKITVVERLNRTGGRLQTDIIEFESGEQVREEEGGMRFNFGMDQLMNLNKKLGICDDIVQFPMGSANDTNRFFLRGHAFTLAEANASENMIWSELYDLKPQEQGLSPTELVTIAFNNVLNANGMVQKPGEPPEFYTKFREEAKWRGKTMNEWTVWGLMRDMGYSEECIQMLTETIGFQGPFLSLANAGSAFQILADFPKDPKYFTFERGFSTLPDRLVQVLETDHGGKVEILLSTNVDAVGGDDGDYTLHMTHSPDDLSADTHVPGGERKTLHAKRLIVAAATKGAEQLFQSSLAFRDRPDAQRLWDAIHSALPMGLLKINLYFDNPWWENGLTNRPPVQFGPNFTGLPINAVYPFYALPEKERLLGEDADGNDLASPPINSSAPAALTIYCDFNNTNFWRGLQNVGPLFDSDMQRKQTGKKPQVLFAASDAVVREARKQLSQLFAVNHVPEPVLTSFRAWDGENDFSFAYHQWRMNVVDSEVRKYLAAPRAGLHFCNEATSDMQGWVNGSLRSCDLALEHMGLKPLPDDPCKPHKPKDILSETLRPRRLGLWGG